MSYLNIDSYSTTDIYINILEISKVSGAVVVTDHIKRKKSLVRKHVKHLIYMVHDLVHQGGPDLRTLIVTALCFLV